MRAAAVIAAVVLGCVCQASRAQHDAGTPANSAGALHVPAEDDAAPPSSANTLHMYMNLIQFAVVARYENKAAIPALRQDQLNLRIDGGPVFHPTHMRLEGDDPLSIAVVIDAGGGQQTLVNALAEAFAKATPEPLHPEDHLTIYAADCAMIASLRNASADSAERLRAGVTDALLNPALHNGKGKPACGYMFRLWDVAGSAAQRLAHEPGRRVLLIISQGMDHDSHTPFLTLSHYLGQEAISVFAIRDEAEHGPARNQEASRGSFGTFAGAGANPRGAIGTNYGPEDPLALLCASNGGVVLDTNSVTAARQIAFLIRMLRERYIIDYPRPDSEKTGLHSMDVSVNIPGAIILSTGASAPIADPTLMKDPNTLPNTPSPAIPGTRRRLPQTP